MNFINYANISQKLSKPTMNKRWPVNDVINLVDQVLCAPGYLQQLEIN